MWPFGGRMSLLQVRECKRSLKYGEDYGLEFGGGKWLGCMTGKPEAGGDVRSNQLISSS